MNLHLNFVENNSHFNIAQNSNLIHCIQLIKQSFNHCHVYTAINGITISGINIYFELLISKEFEFLISTVRIVDIKNSNFWHQQIIVYIKNSNSWYQQFGINVNSACHTLGLLHIRSFPVLIYAPVFAVADHRGQDPASSVLSFELCCYLLIQIQIGVLLRKFYDVWFHRIWIRIRIRYSNALFTESETRFSVNSNPDSIIEYALSLDCAISGTTGWAFHGLVRWAIGLLLVASSAGDEAAQGQSQGKSHLKEN